MGSVNSAFSSPFRRSIRRPYRLPYTNYRSRGTWETYNPDGTAGIIVPNSTDYSASTWVLDMVVTPTALGSANGVIFAQKDGTGMGRSWVYIYAADKSWRSFIGGVALVFTSIPAATLGSTYNVQMEYQQSGGTLKLTVDSVSETKTGVVMESADGDFVIGAQKNEISTDFLTGTVRVWKGSNGKFPVVLS